MIIVSDTTPFRYLIEPAIEIQDGEREAIALALELKADALLMDDKDARKEAKRTGLFIIPTLAALELAAKRDLIDLPEMIERLSKTTFRATPKLFDQILEKDRKRRESK